jgi:hypothetical protein
VCGGPGGPKGFLTVNVEWSYLSDESGIETVLGLDR